MGRAPCCDKTKVKRGPWSPEEDNILKNYVEKYGIGGSWIALPQKAGLKRCGKSCRLRWLNYLRPNIKHGGFTEEEDNIILTLYHNIGSRWSVIAAQLPGRTDNDVKNYWNTKLKKKLLPPGAATPSAAGNFINSTNNLNIGVETTYSRNSSKFDTILPYIPMEVINSHQGLLQAADQIPLPRLMEIPENAKDAYNCGLLVSQEAVSSSTTLSPSFSLDNNNNNANGSSASWSTTGSGEDDAFLAELGSELLMPYDNILNAFDFEEKFSDDQVNHLNFVANISNNEKLQSIYQSLGY